MGDLLSQLTNVIQNPTSNLTAAVLLLAALTLIVLIIIIALLLIVTRRPEPKRRVEASKKRRPEEEYEYPELSLEMAPKLPGEPAPRRRPRSSLLAGISGAWIVAALAVLAVVSGYVVSSTQGYCRDACHVDEPGMTEKAMAAHKSVACVSCHEDGGLSGAPGALAQRTAHLAAQVASGIDVYAAPVPSRRCLACHGDVRGHVFTTVGGARMSHKEPIEAGMACRDCHGQVGHVALVRVAGMAKCVRCHDSKAAPADCRSCHLKDTGTASAEGGATRGFPKVQLGPVTDCGGCHDQVSCDKCHGLRMPHSAEFIQYAHARQAAFERKQVCWRCHTQGDCTACHRFPGHAANFKQEHKTAPRGSSCTCHWPNVPPTAHLKDFCALCH